MDTTSLLIFNIGTIAILIFTWKFSIPTRRYHGLYRFFSFESILVLCIFNIPVWFVDPFRWNQILSWISLVASIFLALSGFSTLRVVGKPNGDFENTTKLVTTGVYSVIRHPLYASLFWLGTGIFLKDITPATIVLAILNCIALIYTARQEETEMIEKFRGEYIIYMEKTKKFIPFIF